VAIEVLVQGNDEEEALVRVTVVDDDDEAGDEPESPAAGSTVDAIARKILEDLLERMDIHAYVTAVRGTVPDQRGEPEETITLHVEGADEEAMSLLIGRRGETLRSVQFMVNLLVSRKVQKWPQVVVDVGNYRQRRQESLEGLARRMAERVRQSGRPLMLEPMGAYERRIVHLALRSDPTVYTESSGEGENRKVVIFPAKQS
jgi:spoIIIJ-associated protein